MPPAADRHFTPSKFDEFLFASVIDESGGQYLTVISTLARLDLDPWEEAARLSGLAKDRAVDDLASMIAGTLAESSLSPEPRSVAARLVDVLPQHRLRPVESRQPRLTEYHQRGPDIRRILTWVMIALTVVAVVWGLSAD